MKKLFIFIASLTIAAVAMIGLASQANATTFNAGVDTAVAKSEVIDGSLYSASDKLKLDGTIDGDVFCAGSSLEVNGTVNGDVICAGQNVNINGVVNGDVRVAGQSVNLTGEINGSLTALGATVSTSDSFKLTGDATILAATVDANGVFGRDLVMSTATANLRGTVARDLSVETESLVLAQDSMIKGDLDYTRQAALEIDQAKVAGVITQHQPQVETRSQTTIQTVISSIMMMVAMIVLYPLFMPGLARKINSYGRQDMVYTVLVGVAAMALVPLVSLLSALTIVGIPLAIVLMLALGIAVIVGLAQAAALLGDYLLGKSTDNTLLQTLGGALVLAIGLQIPIVGILVGMAWMFVGTGLVARYSAKHLLEAPVYKSK